MKQAGRARWFMLMAGVVTAITANTQTHAQVGAQLLLSPWDNHEHYINADDRLFFIPDNQTEAGDDFGLVYSPSRSRIKFDPTNPDPKWRAGYKFDSIMTDNKIGIPADLNDFAVSAGYKVGEIAKDWTLNVGFGLGTANDGHWDNSESWYPLADAAATWIIAPNKFLSVGLSFDGNRNVFPDAPLPFVQYNHFYSETFQYRLGIINGFTWRPTHDLELKADIGSIFNDEIIGIDAKATYFVTEKFQIFGQFENVRTGFFTENSGDDRLFYMANFIDGGARYILNKGFDIAGGIGWAFNQRFASGFDIRDLDTDVELDNNILFFLRLKGTF